MTKLFKRILLYLYRMKYSLMCRLAKEEIEDARQDSYYEGFEV